MFVLYPCHLTGHIYDRFKSDPLNSVSFVFALMLLASTTRHMVKLYTYGIVGKARWVTNAVCIFSYEYLYDIKLSSEVFLREGEMSSNHITPQLVLA